MLVDDRSRRTDTGNMEVLHHRVHEMEIGEAFSRLRSVGIEPILAKGWAIARLYPERGMRPYGDIDLCVHPDHFLKAFLAVTACKDSLAGAKYKGW